LPHFTVATIASACRERSGSSVQPASFAIGLSL
jgi:hypothetical protein